MLFGEARAPHLLPMAHDAGRKARVCETVPRAAYQRGIDAATEALGEEPYKQRYEQGRAMGVEEATTFLLSTESDSKYR